MLIRNGLLKIPLKHVIANAFACAILKEDVQLVNIIAKLFAITINLFI